MVAALMEVVGSLGLGVHSVRLGLVVTQVSLGLGHVADSWGASDGGLRRSDSDGEEDPGAGEEAPELGRGAGWRRQQAVAALMEVAVSLGLGVQLVRLGL